MGKGGEKVILFLDIDGVLNNTTHPRTIGTSKDFVNFVEKWREKYDTPYLCPDNIKTFVKFINEYPEPIYCILSSTWRMGGVDIINKLNFVFEDFGCNNKCLIVGRTGRNKGYGYRGEEIDDMLNYILKEGNEDLISQINNKNYTILDDDNDFLQKQQGNLFLCDSSKGFTDRIVKYIDGWREKGYSIQLKEESVCY